MAALYKRYIPPKPSDVTVSLPLPAFSASTSRPDPASIDNDAPKKRKRERTEEEIAERKAKKLRKKGIDPATVEKDSNINSVPKQNKNKDKQAAIDQTTEDPITKPQGDFAHVKNNKKRHKLEKEARKARKSAAQNAEARDALDGRQKSDTQGESNSPVTTGNEAPDYSKGRKGASEVLPSDSKHNAAEYASTASINSDVPSQKKRKKLKPSKHADEAPAEIETIDNAEDQSSHRDGHDQVASQPKKRRHKLEGILDAAGKGSDQSHDTDDHLRKHARVMSRFSQSKDVSDVAPAQEEQPEHTPPIVLDLAPLPQPPKAATPDFIPDALSLPKWLADPTIISSAAKSQFAELNLHPKLVQHLAQLGFTEAMPVQQALIPLLLPPGNDGARFIPGSEAVLPDIAVGAPTGSGKTIAYLLPMIQSLKATAEDGKLKALVIVPTRELVMQVAAVADSLARGSKVVVGMATGRGSFKDEQARLISSGRRYDPEEHRILMSKLHRQNYPPAEDSEDFEEYLDQLESQDTREEKRLHDASSVLVDHVPTYESAVDILVATPGRLLEHLEKTLGFSLGHLNWLILDEADKLVDQQYDGFLDVVNQELAEPCRSKDQDAQERLLRARESWDDRKERQVRKVVLSATMTTDISKLFDLKLTRPRMILVQGEGGDEHAAAGVSKNQATGTQTFELPPSLVEYCVHAGDGSEKPLHFVELLEQRVLGRLAVHKQDWSNKAKEMEDTQLSDFSSDSSSSSTSSSDHESSSDDSSAEAEDEETETSKEVRPTRSHGEDTIHPDRAAFLERYSVGRKSTSTTPNVLVFVSSTESANRLAHLLGILKPEWTSYIRPMTRADSNKAVLHSSQQSDPIIAISTDRAARGLDTIANKPITHVVQYDVPRSETGYIHRVGRTARAGRRGEAWTLYTHSEARWFYKSICKAASIKRAAAVEKLKIAIQGDEQREKLSRALEGMREDVYGRDHGKGK